MCAFETFVKIQRESRDTESRKLKKCDSAKFTYQGSLVNVNSSFIRFHNKLSLHLVLWGRFLPGVGFQNKILLTNNL